MFGSLLPNFSLKSAIDGTKAEEGGTGLVVGEKHRRLNSLRSTSRHNPLQSEVFQHKAPMEKKDDVAMDALYERLREQRRYLRHNYRKNSASTMKHPRKG